MTARLCQAPGLSNLHTISSTSCCRLCLPKAHVDYEKVYCSFAMTDGGSDCHSGLYYLRIFRTPRVFFFFFLLLTQE